MKEIKEIWRGWQGHFCCECKFHLNTLLIKGRKKIVISTVGQHYSSIENGKMSDIGVDRKYETMVFKSSGDRWDDADVTKELYDFFGAYNDEREAQEGHYEILNRVKEWI